MQTRGLRISDLRVIPLHQELLALRRRQQRQFGEPRVRVGGDAGHQRLHMPGQPFDGPRRKQIRVVNQFAAQPVRPLGQRQAQIKFRVLALERHRPQLQPGQIQTRPRQILQLKRDLKQWRAAGIARRLKFFDQFLERHVLMRVRLQAHIPHAPQEFAKTRIPARVRPQHPRRDEEPDHRFELRAGAARQRRTHHDVGLAAVAVQHRLERRQQQHEQRDALLPQHALECVHDGLLHRHGLRLAVVGLHRRAGVIDRHGQHRQAGQLRLPIRQRRRQRRPLQTAPLPDRVIPILHRQFRQRRGLAGTARRVELRQFPNHDRHRPAVAHDVMNRRQQQMLPRPQAQEQHAPQRAARQIKRRPGFRLKPPVRFGFARRGGLRRQVDDGQRHRRRAGDHLPGFAPHRRKRRPQRLMPRGHQRQRPLERGHVQLPGNAHRAENVVERVVRLELIEEPEALLREGKRQGAAARPPRNAPRWLPRRLLLEQPQLQRLSLARAES